MEQKASQVTAQSLVNTCRWSDRWRCVNACGRSTQSSRRERRQREVLSRCFGGGEDDIVCDSSGCSMCHFHLDANTAMTCSSGSFLSPAAGRRDAFGMQFRKATADVRRPSGSLKLELKCQMVRLVLCEAVRSVWPVAASLCDI